ncbi:MAG: peptidoglycan-N-acetylglucosamine deacetylase [Actinomycetota bacterium]|nr:peptidoglycan-N-acetylglucosamine deacetylase [Actinomycetota bacterium]
MGFRSASGRLRLPPARAVPRVAVAVLVVGLLLAADRVDPVAAGVAVAALVATGMLLRHRSRRGERHAVLVLGTGATIAAVIVALSLPVYRSRPAPLVVRVGEGRLTVPTGPSAVAPNPAGGTEVLGFAASDYDDTAAGIDRDVAGLSTLAVTGATLGSHPGTVEIRPVGDGLVRAHLAGASGLLVISNYDGRDWNGGRVRALVRDKAARNRFVSAVSSAMARTPWDGVVLDFENLDDTVRDTYPTLVTHLAEALGRRRVLITVPAFTDAASDDAAPYDLARLSRRGVGIVWMAYDQHDPTSEAGPLAGLPWVRDSLAAALRSVPPTQLLLGVPAYGYAWPARGQGGEAADLTVPEAAALAGQTGARMAYDPVQEEWGGTLPDGRTLWYDDARSMAARARLAADAHVGVALWRVGSEAPGALDAIGIAPAKHPPQLPGRPVRDVSGPGVVALTFDDGPDPTWTPRILAVLRREHVPATFFVIGQQAERYPGLLRQEVNDGHVIGDHTYSHPDLAKTADWRSRLEIDGAAWAVEGATGRRPLLFRSPYGNGDAAPNNHKLGADQLAADLGFHPVGWTDDTDDWKQPGPGNIVGAALGQLSERTIVLLHDGGGPRGQTVAALPHIIEALKARGYLFTTADALDGETPNAYAVRRGLAASIRGLAVVAAFRLQLALRRLLLWVAVATAVGSLARLLLAGPLALVHRCSRRRRPPPSSVPPPAVTVIIPAYNEERIIAKALAAVARLDPAPTEVIVVDDGSSDATAEVAAAAAREVFAAAGLRDGTERKSVQFRLVRQENSGKAAALNHGLLLTTTPVAVVIDADTVVSPGLIGAFGPHFADPRVGAVAGNVKVGNRRSLLAALQALEYVVALNLDRRAQDVARAMAVVPGASGAFRVAAVRQVGGYQSDTMVEDADLTAALQRAGWRIPYEPAAVAWTEAPEGLTDVVRQRRRWSYGTVQVVAKHRGALLEPAAGNFGLVGLPWNLLSSVVLPVLGPFADLWLLYLVVSGQWGVAAGVLALAVVADLVVAALAVAADGERWSLVALAPLLRLLWRPLQLAVVIRSLRRWAVGEEQSWDKVGRYDTVYLAPAEIDLVELPDGHSAADLPAPTGSPGAGGDQRP